MLSIRQALDAMLPKFRVLESERVPLHESLGRVLAEDVSVQRDSPEFDNSAMDGYALRFADAAANAVLPVAGEVRAGGVPEALAHSAAMRIFTGAPMPLGADTVVLQENTTRAGEHVTIVAAPKRGANVRARGSDYRAGELLLRAGALLGPGEVGVLASQSVVEVSVRRRPRVAILPTGDELRGLSDAPRPYSIVESNSYALAAAVAQAGCVPVQLPFAHDDVEEIAARTEEGLRADVLLTIGGVSVGAYDHVSDALQRAGVTIGFHKVAIKPGKPLLFGTKGDTPVIGLPGNPVSSLVVFEVFVRPCLLRMSGFEAPFREAIDVSLAEGYHHARGRTELVRAHVSKTRDGWLARLLPKQGSAAMSSMIGSIALVILPADCEDFPAGTRLHALALTAPQRSDPPFID
jgi:molybdopterin molybdotransferase